MLLRPILAFIQRPALLPATKISLRCLLALSLAAAINSQAHADTTELEVYQAEVTDKGELNFDFAANAMRGPRHSDNGDQAAFQAIGELSYGLSERCELGVKIPVAYTDGAWLGKSLLGEVKCVAPHEKSGWYWGVEIEAGYFTGLEERQQWSTEIVPVVGYRFAQWNITLNPGVSIASAGDQRGAVIFEPSGKLAYQFAQKTSLGVEYFSEAGRLNAMLPGQKRNELAFLVLDTQIGKSTVNFGLGHGTNSYSPGFAVKAIVDLEFD